MTGFLGAFGAINPLGSSDIALLVTLLALPFAHEDVAIVLGACAIVNDALPVALVMVTIYAGIVLSDCALYGLGAAARHAPWLSRYAVSARVERFSARLLRNVFWLVALCRLVPGVVFVAFIACGWARVSMRRFTAASLVVSAAYLPVVLLLAIKLGGTLDVAIGPSSWPLLLGGFIGAGLMRKRLFSIEAPAEAVVAATRPDGHVAAAERIPPLLFYAPLAAGWIGRAVLHRSGTLPACTNPMIATGGMWGESKSGYFRQVAPDQRCWIADYVTLARSVSPDSAAADHGTALRLAREAGIGFPLVAKPDIGWHGHGVRRIACPAELLAYIDAFPAGETLILQRLAPYDGEAAVLYARLPGEPRGRIESLAFRQVPHVVGDGVSSVRELIERDARARWKSRLHLGGDPTHRGLGPATLARVPRPGERVPLAFVASQRAGGIYHDAGRYVTEALTARFDAICDTMPEFHYGRFDVRFASAAELAKGERFLIVEINGIGGEAIDVWDPELSVAEVYRRLFHQQALLFEIGKRNRSRGFAPPGARAFVGPALRQSRLISRYPASQ